MKKQSSLVTLLLALLAFPSLAAAQAQSPRKPAAESEKRGPEAAQAAVAPQAGQASSLPQLESERIALAYYHFSMGHLYEQLFEQYYDGGGRSGYANQAIENYKKAYELDPRAEVIGERLAEMYAKAQRIREAVLEAQEILKRDPDNLPVRRVLARIYLRTLGEMNPGGPQPETIGRAIEQLREILRVEPDDTESALWLARLYRMQNKPEEAEKALSIVLARQPENEVALEQLSQLLLDQGKAQEAIDLLEKATGDTPTADLLEVLGDAYAQTENHAKAELAFRRAVDMDPGDPSHRQKLARSLLAQQRNEDALEQYLKLAELEPADPENHLRVAQIYRHMGKLDQAEESVLRAKQRAPGSIEVIYNESMIYQAQGRFDDSIRVLSGAVTGLKNRSAREGSRRSLGILYEQLGQLYREVENFTASASTLQEMVALGGEEAQRARGQLIDTYRMAKQIDRALEESQKALAADPKDRGAQINHAMLLGEKGETDQAAALLKGLFSGTRADREIHLTLAQVYERGKRFADAEQSVRLAERLARRPAENEVVWFLLGAIYERQKKFDLAEAEFKKVLELNSKHAGALNYYGYMLADRGIRLDEATDLIKRALVEEPYSGAFLDSLGWAYFKQNKLPEAEETLRKAAARSQHDPTIREHLGDVLFKLGRVEQAATEWEKSLNEWKRSLPVEYEAEKVAAVETKLRQLKNRLAQQKPSGEAKPQN